MRLEKLHAAHLSDKKLVSRIYKNTSKIYEQEILRREN